MWFVSHLFWPLGMFVQIAALIHFFKRRPEWYWLWVILFFGALGAAVYIVAEVIPDAGLARQSFQRYGRRSRISVVEATVRDNPSVANLEELGELYWDQRDYAKAKEVFDRAIATKADSSRTFYRRGQCEMALGDYAGAVPDLEEAIRDDAKTDNYRGEMLLAQAYAAVGRLDDASAWFADAVKRSSTPEVLFSYAEFLASQNRTAEALDWLAQLEDKRKSAPRYMQRVERAWFRRGKSLSSRLKKTATPATTPMTDQP